MFVPKLALVIEKVLTGCTAVVNQLEEWKQEILSAMAGPKIRKNAKDAHDEKLKALEREVLRKDKALAEATALLILQKKSKPDLGEQRRGRKVIAEDRTAVISLVKAAVDGGSSQHKACEVVGIAAKTLQRWTSSFYRILTEEKLLSHRGRSRPRQMSRPAPFEATKPNQIYSWDITS